MYERFYGLRERPFDLTPNPRYLLLTGRHAEALSTMQYGISARKGIVVLIGEAGTGKTTVLRAALGSLPPGGLFVTLSNPSLVRGEFLALLARGFGLTEAAEASKARFLLELTEALERHHRADRQVALICDEAHCLSDDLLEEVRLLANIETDTHKLLPVILTGQPELGERLNAPGLRQLKQRVALRCSLGPLDLGDTAAYIASRIQLAGGNSAGLFTREAVRLVFERSGGIPRTISVICDNALLSGFAADERPVNRHLVQEVCRDLDLDGGSTTSLTTPPRQPGAEPTRPARAGHLEAEGGPAGGEEPREMPAPGPARVSVFAQFVPRRRFSFFSGG